MSAAEMVVKPQQKCPAADDSAPHDQPVLTGQPETSSESDAEEEEEQGGYQLLPQSEEDERGHDQECDNEVYTHSYAHALGAQRTLQSRQSRLSLSAVNLRHHHSVCVCMCVYH